MGGGIAGSYAEDPFATPAASGGGQIPPAGREQHRPALPCARYRRAGRRQFDLLRSDDCQARTTRRHACRHPRRRRPALDFFYIDGIRHNIPFLSALMHHPRLARGQSLTGFISEEFPKGFAGPRARRRDPRAGAAVAAHPSCARRTKPANFRPDERPLVPARAPPCGWLERNRNPRSMLPAKPKDRGAFCRRRDTLGHPHHLVSPGRRVKRSGRARIDAIPWPCSAPTPWHFGSHQGFESLGNSFHRCEAPPPADAGRTKADTGKKRAVPDAWACGVGSRSPKARSQGGETLVVVEAMKIAERAARRTRRHG